MKKLIAKRPIQYQGRTYEPGDALPAHDGGMVEAWTRAGTAAWDDHVGHGGREGGGEGKEAQPAAAPGMLTGHLDAKQLERMTKADLRDLAAKMGVDISTAKNNAQRAAILAAAPVQAPKDENGGDQ